ncbi:MAG: hypothetical protein M1823_004767 [Watsoniomyces obsoletus]|nr:MAG: hypothetical protein M1823_004767 [Watsoniomyces obsoletus]
MQYFLLLWAGLPLISASPAAPPASVPLPTPSPVIHQQDRTFRDIKDDIKSILGSIGSAIPSVVGDGTSIFFDYFPGAGAVQRSLGLNKTQLAAVPTEVLNLPYVGSFKWLWIATQGVKINGGAPQSYGNWTDQGWNLRFRGNVYKQPDILRKRLDQLTNVFLIGTSVQKLPQDQADQARNVTASIFIVQQEKQNVTFHLEAAPSFGSSGEPGVGGAVTPEGGWQNITLPYPTTNMGDFDVFLPLQNVSGKGLRPGNATNQLQRMNVYANGSILGNATSYLVPPEGLTLVSDIDDILRVTKIYRAKEGLLNTFARPYQAWENMPDIFGNWSRSIPDLHFHYLTTTPEQVSRMYMDFIYKTYPGGTFETRPLNFSDFDATIRIRKHLLKKIFETFPRRKFILVADNTNHDILHAYPEMALEFPNQVQCIFLRNTSATDAGNHFPYDTSRFQKLDQNMYMFFRVPDDLKGLDIANGHCYNTSVPQNLTFHRQGLPFGIGKRKKEPGHVVLSPDDGTIKVVRGTKHWPSGATPTVIPS